MPLKAVPSREEVVFLQTQSVVNLTTEFQVRLSIVGGVTLTRQGRNTTEAPTDAAAVSGVETNGAGDLTTFLTGLMTGES